MQITPEQLLIALNLFWLSGFTWFYQSTIKEMKKCLGLMQVEMKKGIVEPSCSERMRNMQKRSDDAFQLSETKMAVEIKSLMSEISLLKNDIRNLRDQIKDLKDD